MAKKLVSALCRADLGKKVRYEFGEGSVLIGELDSVHHLVTNNTTIVRVGGTQQTTSDPEAVIEFI